MKPEKTEKINVLGEKLVIKFNMAVEIAYEEITGESFSIEQLNKQKNCVALYMAAIIANNDKTKITIERLMKDATGKEFVEIAKAVTDSMLEWMKIPSVLPKEKPVEVSEEEEKN